MRLYTRSGDSGDTSLFDGTRVPKDHARVGSYGEVDELNSALGWCRCADAGRLLGDALDTVQRELFVIGAELATPPGARVQDRIPRLDEGSVQRLERWIDEAAEQAPPPRHFVVPGGTELAARLHVARTVCRRAERMAVGLARSGELRPELVMYLNRLGDLLFAWARLANHAAGVMDVLWVSKP
jgi:cob(I)alamin adenosyltransferase